MGQKPTPAGYSAGDPREMSRMGAQTFSGGLLPAVAVVEAPEA